MLVLGLGQLLTAMVKPALALTGNFHLMQVSGQQLPQISSIFSDLQHCWSCILVSPRLLCQSRLLLSQPICRQSRSTSMGLTKILQFGLIRTRIYSSEALLCKFKIMDVPTFRRHDGVSRGDPVGVRDLLSIWAGGAASTGEHCLCKKRRRRKMYKKSSLYR